MTKELKQQLCEFIIGDYCRQNDMIETELTSADIYNQTTLGISMQYLGLTDGWTQEDFDYINSRGGIMKSYVDYNHNSYILSLRDILED